MAACSGRARTSPSAADRSTFNRTSGRFRDTSTHGGLPPRAAGSRMGRRPQSADRISMESHDKEQTRKYATELVALKPEVILAVATSAVEPLQQATRTTPIVFVQVGDPVAAGFVESLARPGGNTTGFTPSEFSMRAKWLELVKEFAPRV